MKRLLLLTTVVFVCAFTSISQERAVPKQISGGIVNGKAILLPKPEYPAAAVAAKAKGEVKVQVLIDEAGNVITAKAVGEAGHTALRSAAEAAALKAKFSPTKLSGNPVKVSGVIVYNFEDPNQGYEEHVMSMGLAMILRVGFHLADDPESAKEFFDGSDFFGEAAVDFPQFATELKSLSKYQSMTAKQREEATERVFTSIRGKIAEADKWQFEVGTALGDMMGVFGPVMNDKAANNQVEIDLEQFESQIRAQVVKINVLVPQAPASFPKPLVEKLKAIGDEASKPKIVTDVNADIFITKFLALIETISPSH